MSPLAPAWRSGTPWLSLFTVRIRVCVYATLSLCPPFCVVSQLHTLHSSRNTELLRWANEQVEVVSETVILKKRRIVVMCSNTVAGRWGWHRYKPVPFFILRMLALGAHKMLSSRETETVAQPAKIRLPGNGHRRPGFVSARALLLKRRTDTRGI
jgi:hypothetical protein